MRIAFIGQKGIPAKSGGVETSVESLAVRMAEAGHDVSVYARSHYTDPSLHEGNGVKLIHLPSIPTKHLDAISHTFLATMHALFQRYDIIHYQSIGPSSFLVIPLMFLRRTKVIATFHCRDYFHGKWGKFAQAYLRFGEWITCRFAEKTIVVSKELQEYVAEKYHRLSIYIPNGATVMEKTDGACLEGFGLQKSRYILSVGRLVAHKGVHYLIKAFLALEKSKKIPKDFKLVIVGSNANTSEYEDYLHQIARESNNILFLGQRSGKELLDIFSNAAIFVQPSESEGMSIALLEAMSWGLPSIVSDIRVNVEVLSGAGVFFRNKNVSDLQDKIAYLLNTPKDAMIFGADAKQRICEQYSWDSNAKQMLLLYEEILHEKSLRNFQSFPHHRRAKKFL